TSTSHQISQYRVPDQIPARSWLARYVRYWARYPLCRREISAAAAKAPALQAAMLPSTFQNVLSRWSMRYATSDNAASHSSHGLDRGPCRAWGRKKAPYPRDRRRTVSSPAAKVGSSRAQLRFPWARARRNSPHSSTAARAEAPALRP